MRYLLLMALATVLVFGGCSRVSSIGDGETDTDTDIDTDVDTDTDADTDTSPPCEADWGWYDDATDLCWENPDVFDERSWDGADIYCDELTLGDHTDWRLPTISELRSLIRGCDISVTGGVCGVTDDCLDSDECYNWYDCSSCEIDAGPGPNGCYWESGLGDCTEIEHPMMCGTGYWSSSLSEGHEDTNGYFVEFSNGAVYVMYKTDCMQYRCVRKIGLGSNR